jgi:hypothetical protein
MSYEFVRGSVLPDMTGAMQVFVDALAGGLRFGVALAAQVGQHG